MPFPNQVYVQPGAGVPGDFASLNPRFTYNAGPGVLVAGSNGVTIGRFAWADPSGDGIVNNTGTGPLSSHACFYDGPTTGAYHYLCLDANANGGPLITVGYGGGASPLPLGIIVNGTAAVTCSGSPTSSFATSGGIVTHC